MGSSLNRHLKKEVCGCRLAVWNNAYYGKFELWAPLKKPIAGTVIAGLTRNLPEFQGIAGQACNDECLTNLFLEVPLSYYNPL
jgi:hypothetical protein